MKQQKKKKKIRVSGLILLLLIGYLIVMAGYYIFTMPIKRIVVTGNKQVTEKEILEKANINVKTSVFKASSSSIKKKVNSIPLVKNVKIKKNILGKITIVIEENKVLFYNEFDSKIYLSDETTVEENNKYIGYPSLVNYVTSDILSRLIEGLSKIDSDIIAMISEIEYRPDEYNGVIIDKERFILRMNDSNIVHVNIVNIEKLNKYQSIVAKVGSGGILYLDSSSNTYIFDKDGIENVYNSEAEEEDQKDED